MSITVNLFRKNDNFMLRTILNQLTLMLYQKRQMFVQCRSVDECERFRDLLIQRSQNPFQVLSLVEFGTSYNEAMMSFVEQGIDINPLIVVIDFESIDDYVLIMPDPEHNDYVYYGPLNYERTDEMFDAWKNSERVDGFLDIMTIASAVLDSEVFIYQEDQENQKFRLTCDENGVPDIEQVHSLTN